MSESQIQNSPIWRTSLWIDGPAFKAFRHGRFVIAELAGPHSVLSTSSCVGGFNDSILHLVNHQSCEASGHGDRFNKIIDAGLDGYHRVVCGEIGLTPETTAVMGTAANMIYAAHHVASHGDVRVDAIVTAGVEGNAATAGDPARWVETPSGWDKLPDVAGTINTIVLVNQPLKPEAQIRSLMTVTEAKTAALMDLGVSSRYSRDMATGTGTDQICLAAPLDPQRYAYGAANPHSKLGELLGIAARSATKSALRWQNGLEPSLTRSLTHALRRFDFSEAVFLDKMRSRLSEASMRLLEGNRNAVLYEPQVAAAAYAFAGVWDRARAGVLPESAMRDVLRQQAATLAAALAADTRRWHTFWLKIDVKLDRPLDAIFDAIALGWMAKWDSTD